MRKLVERQTDRADMIREVHQLVALLVKKWNTMPFARAGSA